MTRKYKTPRKFHYELQVIPKNWFGKLIAGLMVIVILWLAIMFITLFLVFAGLAIVLLVLYSALPFHRNKTRSGVTYDNDSDDKSGAGLKQDVARQNKKTDKKN